MTNIDPTDARWSHYSYLLKSYNHQLAQLKKHHIHRNTVEVVAWELINIIEAMRKLENYTGEWDKDGAAGIETTGLPRCNDDRN